MTVLSLGRRFVLPPGLRSSRLGGLVGSRFRRAGAFCETRPQRCAFTSTAARASPHRNSYDVVVVGGGVVGASVAYHTALADASLRICVVERDLQYKHASAMLSAGGIRQQFSLPVNIQLTLYGMDFLRRLPQDLCVPGCDAPDVQFKEQGYLFLASADGEAALRRNRATQIASGFDGTTLLDPVELAKRFPWLRLDGVALGSLGEHSEGWFDPWALLCALRRKAEYMGVDFIAGRASGFECGLADGRYVGGDAVDDGGARQQINAVHVHGVDGATRMVGSGTVVNAAGAFAAEVVEMLRASAGGGVAPLPVAARKRSMFGITCDSRLGDDAPQQPSNGGTPLVIDPSGVYFRPCSVGRFVCGVSPPEAQDPDCSSVEDLESVQHDLFDEVIWPALYERCEAFGAVKVQSSWAGFYDYNTLDQNAIIGRHPHVANLVLCNGFSGHGLQQSPGAGRAVAELIACGGFKTVDVSCLGFERILRREPLYEQNIV
eukprot:TRINITY_DN39464_c0_g1_i1.p1 TRINITY_DN39464_c0_g1~~TRINITY_DN39464_c0_g1_i1.p1  ORF type:complete len:491 (-),score=81.22 TRINITY_DN39464_c0_g1_i1:208-1680(-)